MARLYATDGEANQAIEEFDRAVELEKDAPFLRLEYADFLQRLRRTDDAMVQIDRAHDLAPDNADVLRVYGQIYFTASAQSPEALKKARMAFEKLREIDSTDIGAMLTLAQIYSGMGQSDEAIAVVEELVSHHPDNRQLNRVLVEALRDAGRNEEAESVLQEILRLDDEALESRLELARIESERGNHTAAIEILEGAGPEIAVHPQLRSSLAQEYHRRALSPGVDAQQRAEDLNRAKEIIDKVITDFPDALSARFTRARILSQLDRFDEAAADLAKVREKVPDDVQTLRLLAGYLEQAGRIQEAAKLLNDNAIRLAEQTDAESVDSLKEQLVGLYAREGDWASVAELSLELLNGREPGPARTALFDLHLESLVRSDQPQKALQALDREEQKFGPSAALSLSRAEVFVELDKKSKAIKALKAPILQQKLERGEVLRLANLLYDLGEQEVAHSVLDRHAEGGTWDDFFTVGQFFSIQQDFERSIQYLLKAAERATDEDADAAIEVQFWLGQAYERTARYDEAAGAFLKVLDANPTHATTLNYLGYMWADLGIELDKALEMIETAVAQQPENGAFMDSLGWVLFKLGRYEEAQEKLLQATRLVPEDPTIYEHLGDVRLALGRVVEARQAYEQALAINDEGNVEDVRRKLEKLNSEL